MPRTSPLELVFTLVALVLVIVLAYFVSKWIGRRGGLQAQGGLKHFKVIDKLFLAQDRAIYIVKVGQKTMLLGVTQHHIENLGEVEIDESISLDKPAPQSFSDTFKAALKNGWGIGTNKSNPDKPSADGEETHKRDDV